MPLAGPRLMSHVTRRTRSGSPLWAMRSSANRFTATGNQWVGGIPVTFKVYYFTGSAKRVLKTIKCSTGGITQVAAVTTTFTHSGQTNTVIAKATTSAIGTDASDLPDCQVADDTAGLFGTWV